MKRILCLEISVFELHKNINSHSNPFSNDIFVLFFFLFFAQPENFLYGTE